MLKISDARAIVLTTVRFRLSVPWASVLRRRFSFLADAAVPLLLIGGRSGLLVWHRCFAVERFGNRVGDRLERLRTDKRELEAFCAFLRKTAICEPEDCGLG